MIASVAAVGLSPLGDSSSPAPDLEDEEVTAPDESPSGKSFPDGPAQTIVAGKNYKAVLKTNKGDIEIQLSSEAPKAVNSFAFLASNGFYDGTIFFYVDRDFVAQAGDPTCSLESQTDCSGVGTPGYTLPIEKTSQSHGQWAVVAPAVSEGQEVHGSQFRILYRADPRLDGKETVFGKVTAGQQVLESLPQSFIPCSVTQAPGCVSNADLSSQALVVQEVTVQPA